VKLTAAMLAARFRSNAGLKVSILPSIGPWEVHHIPDQRHTRTIYSYLIFFFQGALGLPPHEVRYFTSIEDSTWKTLRSDSDYVVTGSSLDFFCDWWSLTVYAADKYLVKTDLKIYSVVSKFYANKSATDGFKIYLSAEPPCPYSPYASMPWIPLPPRNPQDGDSDSLSGKVGILKRLFQVFFPPENLDPREFRLVFRAYLPDPKQWTGDGVYNLPLPTIERID
jgi:hypothetical protein